MTINDHAVKDKLRAKGVAMPCPETVAIDGDVNPDRISGDGVTLYGGCRIQGKDTLILPGCILGYEAPVTLENCRLGHRVRLHGGYFGNAVFAGDNVVGANAHVRAGTILEEEACAAHTVGLKQTILFPFVTLGSLINFCDCFMAGGTSRKNHSEVGSSFVHFNYTPNQDKATPSMMGNVHQGVMLDQPPIFLGGQGGLVGPVRIGFGCLTGAGSIVRRDEERPNRMILAAGTRSVSLPRRPAMVTGAHRIFNHNIRYIAALIALASWYAHVRPLVAGDGLSIQLVEGLQTTLTDCIRERIRQLEKFCDSLSGTGGREPVTAAMETAKRALDATPLTGSEPSGMTPDGEAFLTALQRQTEKSREKEAYVSVIQALPREMKRLGSQWLSAVETRWSDALCIRPEKQGQGTRQGNDVNR